jgi:DNA repair exonuclease SbcCD ATPase subunit
MILERLHVDSLGCFYEPMGLTFTQGINIIAGNNETGKSTLITALHHALFTPYTSQAVEVKNLQPWGTELSPKVEVELCIDGTLYRVRKRFLYDSECILAEYREGRWRNIASGDRADERIRSFLLAEKPRGAAGAKNRGLARLLWLPQDEDLSIEIDGVLRNRVEACLGVATLDEVENRVADAIDERYARFWTKTGKLTRGTKGSGLPELDSRISELESECSELDRVIRQMEQQSMDLQQIQEQKATLKQEQKEIKAERYAQGEAAKEAALLRHNLEKAREQLKSWQKAFELADERRWRLKDAKEISKKAKERLEVVNEQLKASEKELADLMEERRTLAKTLEETLALADKLQSKLNHARMLNYAKDQQDRLTQMTKRREVVDRLEAEIDSKKKELAELPSPTKKNVAEAQQLERTIERLSGKLESAGLSLTFKAYSPQTGLFQRDNEGHDAFTVAPEELASFKMARQGRLILDGVGEMEIQSGAQEVAGLQKDLRERQEELESVLAPFSASTSTDLERLRLEKGQAEKELDDLINKLGQYLESGGSPDNLRSQIANLERELEGLCAKLGVKFADLVNLSSIDLTSLEQEQDSVRKQEADLRIKEKIQNDAMEQARATQGEYERKRIGIEAEVTGAKKVMTELISAAGSEQSIEDEYRTARREREAAQERVSELEESLPEPEVDPEALVQRLTQKLEEIDEEIRALELKEVRIRTTIDAIAQQDTYGKLIASQEKLETLKQEYQRQMGEAKAVRLLKGLFDTRRQEMVAELTEPVSRRVTNYFERVSGLTDRHIGFDELLQPTLINTPDIEGASPTSLSTGAREQLYVLTRLALARYLAEEEGRMLFVFDDSLVNTDQVRHQRFIQLLEEAGSSLQILIMTCHGERYRGIREATYHAMP